MDYFNLKKDDAPSKKINYLNKSTKITSASTKLFLTGKK